RVGAYLRAHPSLRMLDEQKLAPTYRNLARLEQEPGPLFPLAPDNTICYPPYDRRLHVLKSELLAEIIERFYIETTALAFEMLDAVRQGQDRLLLGLDLMFT